MKTRGFTLIELLVVIGIIAAFSLITLPTLSHYTAQVCLHAAARGLIAEIRGLQNQARLQHETVCLDLADLSLPAGIKLAKSSHIAFAASGFPPPGGSGTLILANRFGRQKKIIVSAAGRVRLE